MKILIVTVAGMSTRFSRSLGYDCLKCLYFREDIRESMLYRLLRQPVYFDKYIIVGGYKFTELQETVECWFSDMFDRIILVENPYFAKYGSGYSLYFGIKEALKYKFNQIVFAEGDLSVDAGSFSRMYASAKDVVTISPDPIQAEKSVVFYKDRCDCLHYLYDTGHDTLFIPEPFKSVCNSGQMWKFANSQRVRDTYDGMSETEWRGTNLVFVERYFESMPGNEYDEIRLSHWVNCNTVEDFERIRMFDHYARGEERL